jgi:hypothetical protein
MAITAVKQVRELDPGFVLAPERYDPRRTNGLTDLSVAMIKLSEVVFVARETLIPAKASETGSYLVFDSGDAKNGVISNGKPPGDRSSIGSAKKVVAPGDVIISRLRSYLRQVAWLDEGIRDCWKAEQVTLAASTEFYVLRSINGRSIAFLVPFLLSDSVQAILAAAQEGGHHPRFREKALLSLLVPPEIIKIRDELSQTIEQSVRSIRAADLEISRLIGTVETITK